MGTQGGHPVGFPSSTAGVGSVVNIRFKGKTIPVQWDGITDIQSALGYILKQFGEEGPAKNSMGAGGLKARTSGATEGPVPADIANTNPLKGQGSQGIVFRRFTKRYRLTPVNVPSLHAIQATLKAAGEDLSGIPLLDLEEIP